MYKKFLVFLGLALLISGCQISKSVENNETVAVEAVKDMNYYKFSGIWYEIATLKSDEIAARTNSTINYSINENGRMSYLKRYFEDGKDRVSKGKIRPIDGKSGALEISEWGIFYEPYNVINLDGELETALIIGENNFWLISRKKAFPELLRAIYEEQILERGFTTNQIHWVEHK